jgi:hypothetical protein
MSNTSGCVEPFVGFSRASSNRISERGSQRGWGCTHAEAVCRPAATREEGDLIDHTVSAGDAYTLAVQEDRFDPGTPSEFRFEVLDPDGEAVTDYRPLHERDLHLIVPARRTRLATGSCSARCSDT